jgi:hypothetical protein
VERDDLTATLTMMQNNCDVSTGIVTKADYKDGESSGCVAVASPFYSVILTGEWLGYKIYTDAKCQTLASINQVDVNSNCYSIEGAGALAWSYSNF